MNITHICLNGTVTDHFSYQENLLTKYQKLNGDKITIIASEWVRDSNGQLMKDTRSDYINENDIRVIRLKLKGIDRWKKKIRRYKNLIDTIDYTQPHILFIHGCQNIEIKKIVEYLKDNLQVVVFVDNHVDFSNSARTWLSKNILHKIIWKKYANLIEPYTKKFYGVLPARVDFLVDIYKLPNQKVALLEMGADDERVKEVNRLNVRVNTREKYGIEDDDFLITTGGKIDFSKIQTLNLINAVKNINNSKVKLLIFGSIIPELKKDIDSLLEDGKVIYIGWMKSEDTYELFASSDLVIFPGRHSVFWEQTVGQGIPLIVKYWEGTTHIDVGGNLKFLYKDNISEIESIINLLVNNDQEYNKMKSIAQSKGIEQFSYRRIAKKSIE